MVDAQPNTRRRSRNVRDGKFEGQDLALMSRIITQAQQQGPGDNNRYYLQFRGNFYQSTEAYYKPPKKPLTRIELKDSYDGDDLKLTPNDPMGIYNDLFTRLGDMGFIERGVKRVQMQQFVDGAKFMLVINEDDLAGLKEAFVRCRNRERFEQESPAASASR